MPTSSSSVSANGSASSIVASTVSGYHTLKIVGYSSTKDLPNGKWIDCCPFRLGGRTWHLRYCPTNGVDSEHMDYISFFLKLDDTLAEAETLKVKYTFSLLDQDGKPVPSYIRTFIEEYSVANYSWGVGKFIKRVELEESEHLKDDSFTVKVDVTMSEFHAQGTPPTLVPPSDMHQHFGDLLTSKAGVDVEFRVGGETFSAHRSVLAARSPVFKAQFYGPMKEGTTTETIFIDGMEPQVFNVLLAFMYTDALPDMDQQDESAMFQHLLVAADLYRLERLKLICEDKLRSGIDASSVATILVLAGQHRCLELKDACLDFLFNSSTNMNAFLESEGFEYLKKSHPGVLKDLLRYKGATINLGKQD